MVVSGLIKLANFMPVHCIYTGHNNQASRANAIRYITRDLPKATKVEWHHIKDQSIFVVLAHFQSHMKG